MSPATVLSSIQVRIARTAAPAIPSIRTGVTTEAAGAQSGRRTRPLALHGSDHTGIGRNHKRPRWPEPVRRIGKIARLRLSMEHAQGVRVLRAKVPAGPEWLHEISFESFPVTPVRLPTEARPSVVLEHMV